MSTIIQLRLVNLGYLLETVDQNLKDPDICENLFKLITLTIKTFKERANETIQLIDNMPDTELKKQYKSSLLGRISSYIKMRDFHLAHLLFSNRLTTKQKDKLQNIFSCDQLQQDIQAYFNNNRNAPNTEISIYTDMSFTNLPKYLWDTIVSYTINHFQTPVSFAEYNLIQKISFYVMKTAQYIIEGIIDPLENIVRSSLKEIFYFLRHPTLDKTDDSDEDINLNFLQVAIKDLWIGIDDFLQNIFALKMLVAHPVECGKAFYNALMSFLNRTDKMEVLTTAIKNKLKHFLEHPLQHAPQMIMLVLSIVLPIIFLKQATVASAASAAPYVLMKKSTFKAAMISATPISIATTKEVATKTVILAPFLAEASLANSHLLAAPAVANSLNLVRPLTAIAGGAVLATGIWASSSTNEPAIENEKSGSILVLQDQLDLLTNNREQLGIKKDSALDEEITSEEERIKANLRLLDPSFTRKERKTVKRKIVLLQNNLEYLSETYKDQKIAQKIQEEIAALKIKLADYDALPEIQSWRTEKATRVSSSTSSFYYDTTENKHSLSSNTATIEKTLVYN